MSGGRAVEVEGRFARKRERSNDMQFSRGVDAQKRLQGKCRHMLTIA